MRKFLIRAGILLLCLLAILLLSLIPALKNYLVDRRAYKILGHQCLPKESFEINRGSASYYGPPSVDLEEVASTPELRQRLQIVAS